MVNIMETYKKNFGSGDDTVWHKFDKARPADTLNGGNANISGPITPGGTSSPGGSYEPLGVGVLSPPASPRFPQNHEGSFENPRAPPPIPTEMGIRKSPKSGHSSGGFIASRTAPKPPTSKAFTAARQAPQLPTMKDLPVRQSQDNQRPFAPPPPSEAMPSRKASQRSISGMKSNGNTPPRMPQGAISSPIMYQQQQESAMAASQQALSSKIDRKLSVKQQPPIIPVPPKNSYSPIQPASVESSPIAPPTQFANQPDPALVQPQQQPKIGAVPRQRPRQRQASNGLEITAKLQAICTQGDPTIRYHGLSKIGQGASGGVFIAYEGSNKHNVVAIKQMNLEQQPKKDLIINEILVMKDSKHKNIVNFMDSYLHQGDLWVVMEYMEGGSLTDVVTFNIMTEGQIAAVCKEVSQVRFLSSENANLDLDIERSATFALKGRHSPRHKV